MLPARAILFVLFIIFAITLIVGGLLLLSDLQQVQLEENLWEQRVLNNLKSGEAILKTSTATISKQTIDLFDTKIDSITIEKYWWGLFQIGTIEAFKTFSNRSLNYRKVLFFGSSLKEEQKSALYLKDVDQPLALAGKIKIKGNVFLPRAGAKRAYINGEGFLGTQLFEGKQKQSKRYIPKINETPFLPMIDYFVNNFPESNAQLKDTLRQSFHNETKIIRNEIIYLDKQYLQGKIILMADSLVYIGSNAYLENVIIIAPYILIDKGFQGQIQAFASKFIRIGENVNLSYPSIAMVLKTEGTPMIEKNLIIEKNATIQGLVSLYQFKKMDLPAIPSMEIQKEATIIGQVYSNEKLYLEGQVFGNVTCAGFRVQTSASIYDNHLYNTTIDFSKLPKTYVSPSFLEGMKSSELIFDVN
jgi:hypothetical protein